MYVTDLQILLQPSKSSIDLAVISVDDASIILSILYVATNIIEHQSY